MTTPAQPTMLDSSPPTDVGEPVLSPVVAARDSVQRHLRPGARLDLNDTITFLPFEFLMAMLDTHFRDEGQAFVAQDVQTALRDRGQSHAERTTALEALARYYMTTLIVPRTNYWPLSRTSPDQDLLFQCVKSSAPPPLRTTRRGTYPSSTKPGSKNFIRPLGTASHLCIVW